MSSGNGSHPLFDKARRGARQHATGEGHEGSTQGVDGREADRPKRRRSHNRAASSNDPAQAAEEPKRKPSPGGRADPSTDQESEFGLRGEDFKEDLDAESDRTPDTETESDEDLMASKVESRQATDLAEDGADFALYCEDFHQAY